MPAVKLHNGRRTRVASSAGVLVGVLAIVALGPLACAANHHISEPPPHPIAVRIQNNLPAPRELTVFLSHDQGGMRQMIGTVPGSKSETFEYTPVSWDITYRLLATSGGQPEGEDCRNCVAISPGFSVNDPNTGGVVWNLRANQVQFYDLPEQQHAPAKDTTKAPAPSGTQ